MKILQRVAIALCVLVAIVFVLRIVGIILSWILPILLLVGAGLIVLWIVRIAKHKAVG